MNIFIFNTLMLVQGDYYIFLVIYLVIKLLKVDKIEKMFKVTFAPLPTFGNHHKIYNKYKLYLNKQVLKIWTAKNNY